MSFYFHDRIFVKSPQYMTIFFSYIIKKAKPSSFVLWKQTRAYTSKKNTFHEEIWFLQTEIFSKLKVIYSSIQEVLKAS